jgi:hypothetical protein
MGWLLVDEDGENHAGLERLALAVSHCLVGFPVAP